MHITRSIDRKKVGVNGRQKNHIERAVREREAVFRRLLVSAGVIGAIRQVRVMKAECRLTRGDCLTAPGDCLFVDFYAIVSPTKISNQSDRQIAYAGSDVQHAVLWAQAGDLQFRPRTGARTCEGFWPPSAVVINSQVGWWQERVVSPRRNMIEDGQATVR